MTKEIATFGDIVMTDINFTAIKISADIKKEFDHKPVYHK